MKLRFLSAILIFISAYSPLSIIFLLQDLDLDAMKIKHPGVVLTVLGASAVSCLVIWLAVRFLKVSSPPVVIKRVSNRSGELINYSIPYMISFFVLDLGNVNSLLSFGFFMCVMFWLTLKTHNIFINPILATMGYNLYDVVYEKDGEEYEDFFLIHGGRPRVSDRCRIAEVSENLYLVTDRDPEV